jgi:hypothetical protein
MFIRLGYAAKIQFELTKTGEFISSHHHHHHHHHSGSTVLVRTLAASHTEVS